jgi:hypothetical protein
VAVVVVEVVVDPRLPDAPLVVTGGATPPPPLHADSIVTSPRAARRFFAKTFCIGKFTTFASFKPRQR